MKRFILIAAGLLVANLTFAASFDFVHKSRFGNLAIDSSDIPVKVLFNGRPVKGIIDENTSMTSLVKGFSIQDADVIVVSGFQGQACPSLYHFIVIDKVGVKTPNIEGHGTCGELKTIKQDGEKIFFSVRGYAGPMEPQKTQTREYNKTYKYVFDGKKVFELK